MMYTYLKEYKEKEFLTQPCNSRFVSAINEHHNLQRKHVFPYSTPLHIAPKSFIQIIHL